MSPTSTQNVTDLARDSALSLGHLTQTSVTLRTGASINGRLLAQTAVNIDGSTVVEPPR
jgi:hypothetical protein